MTRRLRPARPAPAVASACLIALLSLTAGLGTSGATFTGSTSATATWATKPAAGAYALAVADDTPSGYWHLGETGPTFADSSSNGHPLTLVGTGGQGASGIPGRGNDKAFSTGPAYGTAADAAWNSPTGSFAVEAWLKWDGGGGEAYLVEKYDTPANNGFILRMNGGRPYGYTLNTSSLAAVTGPVLTAGAWSHLVFSFDASTGSGTLYVNGTQVDTKQIPAPTDGTSTLKVGARGDDAAKVPVGDLDEVAFYSHPLSASRVAAHYTAGSTSP